jgi:hypothetical protein
LPFEQGGNEIDILPLLTRNPTKIRVRGISMLPFLDEDDELEVVAAAKQDFETGDLIVFNREGDLIVHRIIKMNGSSFLEMGDNQRIGTWLNWQARLGKVVSILKKDASVVDLKSESQRKFKKKTVTYQKIRHVRTLLEKKTRFYSLKKLIGLPFRVMEYLVKGSSFL